MALLDRFQRNIVKCSNCGEEIARGENLGFTSALCAKCSAEVLPQFKKDEIPYVPPPFPVRGTPVILPEEDTGKHDIVAISAYEDPNAKPKKKKKEQKPKGKSISKAIKSLTRLK